MVDSRADNGPPPSESGPSPESALAEIWRRQQQILGRVALGGDRETILSDIVRLAEEQTGDGMLASILLLSDDGRHLHLGGAPSLPDAYNSAIEGMAIGMGEGSCGTAAASGEAVFVDDIATDPLWADFRDLAMQHGLASCWSVPIKAGDGRVLGTFANYYGEPRAPSPLDRAIIEAIALTTSIAVERIQLEKSRHRAEEAKALVLEELQHRVKNAFALAQSLINLNVPSALGARDLADKVNGKLRAIAAAQDLIIASHPERVKRETALLRKVLLTILGPLGHGDTDTRIALAGEDHEIRAEALSSLAMIFHEFATNAAKYGALTTHEGAVQIAWAREGDDMVIEWIETAGPPPTAPTATGFGTRLVSSSVRQLGGTIEQEWRPSGLYVTLRLPCKFLLA